MKPSARERPQTAPDQVARQVRARLEQSLSEWSLPAARPVFLQRIEKFAALLAFWGSRTNLTARPSDAAETTFHILDSLAPVLLIAPSPERDALLQALGAHRRVLDVGSGAGFPALVLAAACDAQFCLYEARHKRASFLTVAAAELGLSNVEVRTRRASSSEFAADFDLVTARALGPLPQFYEIASAALLRGGHAMLYASRSQRLALAYARTAGFGEHHRLSYRLPRYREPQRLLVIWTKL